MVSDSCPNPQSVGREFVRQYYTMLNQSPHYLHRFYSSESYFVHGGLEPYSRDMTPSIGQKEIHKRVQELNFRDCHAKILQVDSQNTLGNGVVVHVTGELSNCGQPMRRFAQTFVLAAQSPKKYYVHNDIFRYQDVIMNEDDVNEEADSGQSDGEENGEVEQAPVIQQPPHQVNYYNTPIPGQNVNGIAMNVIPTSVPVQQLPPEQIPVQVQQHVPTITAPVQNSAPTVLPPSSTVSRTQPAYNQNNQVPNEQPKVQHQEEPANHVETKEVQEPTKKETPSTEVVTPGDQPKPLYAQLFKSGGRSSETHSETPQAVSAPSQNYSTPSLPKSTSPVRNNDYSNNSFGNNHYEQRNNMNRNVRNNNYNNRGGGVGGRNNNMNERPNRNTFTSRSDNGYNSGPGNDTRINRGNNQPGSYNGMFQSDDQQLFIGKIPPEVLESDLRNLFEKFGNLLDVRIMKGGSKTGDPSMNGNFGFVIFESIETAHKVLKSRPIMFPDENGIKLNVEEKKNKSRSSMVNPDGGGLGRGGMRSGNSRGGFNRNQNDGPRNNYRRQN